MAKIKVHYRSEVDIIQVIDEKDCECSFEEVKENASCFVTELYQD